MPPPEPADPTVPEGEDTGWAAYPRLPPGLRVGTVTAATQVEGAHDEDGRAPSIWDTFSRRPGAIADASTPCVGADHYHRVGQDVGLLRDLGVDAHRFSLSWSRIQPSGTGAVDPRGLDFYDRFVDELLGAGISPTATLHHWDLPQALQDDGGWLNRSTIEAFAGYASIVGARLGDRVEQWVPVDEPNVAALLGHAHGVHAPGIALGLAGLGVGHHLLLGHGRAVIALREAGARGVGCANNHAPMWPASDDPADIGATKLFDAVWNGAFLEPMLLGRYPSDLAPLLEDLVKDGDLATIRQPLDFYGVSYDRPMKVAAAGEGAEMPFELVSLVGYPVTDLGWPVVPEALREWLIMLRARYRAALPPIVVTGSGCSYSVEPDADGVVHDEARIEHLAGHLKAVSAAVERGVDVRGFYVRSLLDGWEWSNGFTQRFGLVHVDPVTQARAPKKSFEWLAAVLAARG